MSAHDPRLDAEERRIAAVLPRLSGRGEPSAALDAAILASARRAVQADAGAPHTPPRRRWVAPVALAASLCLALGLAWRMQPSLQPAPAAAPESADAPAVQMIEPPPMAANAAAPVGGALPAEPSQAAAAAAPPEPEPQARTDPPPRVLPPHPRLAAPPVAQSAAMEAAPVVMDAPAPIPAPAAPSPAASAAESRSLDAITVTGSAANDAAAPAAKAASTIDIARPAAQEDAGRQRTASKPQAAPASPPPASMHADDEVPPATADDPAVRDAWLRDIQRLLSAGKTEEARASLREFRRRYPRHPLPEALRALGD